MKPVVALIGRPNVGKSTLFNQLTRSRQALVADLAGLTRDRQYGDATFEDKSFIVIDTGGIGEDDNGDGTIDDYMAAQSHTAIHEADMIVFVVDTRAGITGADETIAKQLHTLGKPVLLVANKIDGVHEAAVNEFFELGFGEPFPMAASHGRGVSNLLETLTKDIPTNDEADTAPEGLRIAIIGRPNVGKSTLVNRLLGEDRVVVFDMPGTTRDSIYIPYEREGRNYVLIDTAGVRRRGRIDEKVEKFSVVKTLQAISDANVAILMLDANQDISEQDAHVAGFILESGRALVVAVNKWDTVDAYEKDRVKVDIVRKLMFLDFAKFHFTSAIKGQGIDALLKSVLEAHAAAFAKLPTPKLTRVLQAAIEHQAPPRKGQGSARPKLRYAHQGGQNPPIIVIHGNSLENVPKTYQRYLEGRFREAFKLQGTPLRIQFKASSNPFSERDK